MSLLLTHLSGIVSSVIHSGTNKKAANTSTSLPKTKRTSQLPDISTPRVIRKSPRINLKTIKEKEAVPEPVDDDPIRREPNRQDSNSEGELEHEEGAGEGDDNEEGGDEEEEGEDDEHEDDKDYDDDEESDDEKERDDDEDYNESQEEDEESNSDQSSDDNEGILAIVESISKCLTR